MGWGAFIIMSVAVMCAATLGMAVWKLVQTHKMARRLRQSVKFYEPLDDDYSERLHWYQSANPERVAHKLLTRLFGEPSPTYHTLTIKGGKTGHTYDIAQRFMWPIHNRTTNELLCATPYNCHKIPRGDIMLAQALYLSCPDTELQFLAVCNRMPHFIPKTRNNRSN